MAQLGVTMPTLIDVAKRLDPDGKIADIAEMLSMTNEVLTEMPFLEGNLPTGHRTTIRTGLPTVAWRLLNAGVQPSKSTTAQIDEQTGMLEAYSEVDVDLAKLNGNTSAFRLSEAAAFVEAMSQEMAATLFYGNSGSAPEEFTGLTVRYSSLSAPNGQNIVDCGANSGDGTSMWLIVWGPNTVHGIYPKGSVAGLQHKDLGEVTVENANGVTGARMQAYRDHWQWKCGIALRDWRYAVRIANIDISVLVADPTAATLNLTQNMIKAIHRIPSMGLGRPVFYCNRTVLAMLDIQRYNAVKNASIDYSVIDGKWAPSFRGIPIRTTDALLENEADVT